MPCGLHNVSSSRARAPCPELVRLRNAGSEAWKQAMRVLSSERCAALHDAFLATEAAPTFLCQPWTK